MKNSCSILFLCIIVLSVCLPTANAFVKLIAIPAKIDLNFNVRVFNISYILHHPTSTTNQSLEFQVEIKRAIKDLKFVVILHGMARNGTISAVLLKRQVDGCSFLRNTNSDRLVKSIYDYLTARSNLPTRCPIMPGHYYLRDLKLSDVPVPAFLPETEFLLEFLYFSGVRTETWFEARMYGKLVRIIENILF